MNKGGEPMAMPTSGMNSDDMGKKFVSLPDFKAFEKKVNGLISGAQEQIN